MEFAPAYISFSSQVVEEEGKKICVLKKCHLFYSVDVLPVNSKQPTMMNPASSSSFISNHHNSTSPAVTSTVSSSSLWSSFSNNEDPTTDPTGVYSILKTSRELSAHRHHHVSSTLGHLIDGSCHTSFKTCNGKNARLKVHLTMPRPP